MNRLRAFVLLSLLTSLMWAILSNPAVGQTNKGDMTGSTSVADPPLKPKLSYLLSNDENLDDLVSDLNLTTDQKREIELIIERQADGLRRLDEASNLIVDSANRSLSEKKDQIKKMDYNADAMALESGARMEIMAVIGGQDGLFEKWIDETWTHEVATHGINAFGASGTPLSYRVYATQYDGYTNYEVAVPDKYLKFANLGWEHRPGYERNDYAIDLDYGAKSVRNVKILEVGPWNIDDNYWNDAGAQARPRRLYTDLPKGMPEAQAAFFDDYNGGKDHLGRVVLNPAGIDLTPAGAKVLGIGKYQNKWIDVTYTWETGRGASPIASVVTPFLSTDISKTTKFRVEWWADWSNAGSRITSYDVQYKIAGGNWRKWKTNTTRKAASFLGRAGRVYYFRVKATDNTGRVSQWSRYKRTIVPYDGNKLILRRAGFANTFRNTRSRFYQDTLRYSTKARDSIVYRFIGRRLYLISTKNRRRSKAKIYVDGRYIKTINTYSRKSRFRQVVFKKAWSKRGTHTLRIVNLGNKRLFDVDGLGVVR
ncbi:MAG TPA: hypothetical protein ENI11_00740 [Actinobacteria bacterium]|nr:hypothetical protein [Actinomycetota bacterium]